MGVPKAVLEQAERAEQLLREVTKKDEPSGKEEPAKAEVQADDEKAPSRETPQEAVAPQYDDAKGAEKDDGPKPTPEHHQDKQQQEDPDYWRHKYMVLQGKYNAEVPRLVAREKELRKKIEEMESKVAQLQMAQQARKDEDDDAFGGSGPGDHDERPQVDDSFDPSVFEDYGEEFVALAKRNAALEAQIQELKAVLESVTAQTRETAAERYAAKVVELCPRFYEIDSDPAFAQWVEEIDPLSGISRKALLLEAHQAMDADRVAGIYNEYARQSGMMTKERGSTPSAAKRSYRPPDVQAQAIPDASGSSSPSDSEGKRLWTREMIRKFYADMAKGRYTAERAAAIEKDLHAAVREGRVVG